MAAAKKEEEEEVVVEEEVEEAQGWCVLVWRSVNAGGYVQKWRLTRPSSTPPQSPCLCRMLSAE